MSTKIEIDKLCVDIANRPILTNLSLQVECGAIVGLLGPNGSGKSTALAVLLGLVKPVSGKLIVDGAPTDWGSAFIRQQSGVVFQSSTVDAMLSPLENLRLNAKLYQSPKETGRVLGAIQTWMSKLGLADRMHDTVKTFSGGMRRKVDLARALMISPKILFLDEPTSGVDEPSCNVFWDEVETLRKQGTTVLLATHKNEEAERCDHVALMQNGKLLKEGSPDSLKASLAADILTLELKAKPGLTKHAALLETRAQLEHHLGAAPVKPHIDEDAIVLRIPAAHEMIPRILEWLGPGNVQSVAVRKPSLLDVLAMLTQERPTA